MLGPVRHSAEMSDAGTGLFNRGKPVTMAIELTPMAVPMGVWWHVVEIRSFNRVSKNVTWGPRIQMLGPVRHSAEMPDAGTVLFKWEKPVTMAIVLTPTDAVIVVRFQAHV